MPAKKSEKKERLKSMSDSLLSGDRRALSKMITLIEDIDEDSLEVLEYIYPECGKSYQIGITGPPGSGKSTLVDQLIMHIRKKLKKKVGVIAVDPSSPFSGGALLGDRIRMQDHYNDEGVFIRSISSRGQRGGITFSTRLLTKLLDAFGFDFIIIETVGVGQSEVDIMELAHTTGVVLVPESGDTVQTMKAGLLEIADIFIVNKADREGAGIIAEELRQMVSMENLRYKNYRPAIVSTEALNGKGIEELFSLIEAHRSFIQESNFIDKRVIKRREIVEITLSMLKMKVEKNMANDKKLMDKLEDEGLNPFAIAKKILKNLAK